jgi:fucose 4-O-acetylase-like acetyltransferase
VYEFDATPFGLHLYHCHSTPLAEHIYDWIYYFHMPAFILVTGYLSRSFEWTRRHLLSSVTMLLVPYVIFEGLMAWFRVNVGGEDPLQNLWLNPHWPMWYLVVLFLWRMVTPILKRHWLAIPASIAISLAAGQVSIEYLDINRFLGFLPFFVAGLHLTPGALRRFRARGSWQFGS